MHRKSIKFTAAVLAAILAASPSAAYAAENTDNGQQVTETVIEKGIGQDHQQEEAGREKNQEKNDSDVKSVQEDMIPVPENTKEAETESSGSSEGVAGNETDEQIKSGTGTEKEEEKEKSSEEREEKDLSVGAEEKKEKDLPETAEKTEEIKEKAEETEEKITRAQEDAQDISSDPTAAENMPAAEDIIQEGSPVQTETGWKKVQWRREIHTSESGIRDHGDRGKEIRLRTGRETPGGSRMDHDRRKRILYRGRWICVCPFVDNRQQWKQVSYRRNRKEDKRIDRDRRRPLLSGRKRHPEDRVVRTERKKILCG